MSMETWEIVITCLSFSLSLFSSSSLSMSGRKLVSTSGFFPNLLFFSAGSGSEEEEAAAADVEAAAAALVLGPADVLGFT